MAGDTAPSDRTMPSRSHASRITTNFCATTPTPSSRPARASSVFPKAKWATARSHLNIGAGRVVYMDITKIDAMIENGTFFSNPVLMKAMKRAQSGGRRLHIFGLVSDGGVHSHQNHLYALLKMAKQNGLERVFVHCFMDGRDTLPTSGC